MHSYISNSIFINGNRIERELSTSDSMLELFMLFFNYTATRQNILSKSIKPILNHYDIELTGIHGSFIDLKIEDVYQNPNIFKEYIFVLQKMETLLLKDFGESIDNEYINNTKKIGRTATEPISTNLILDFIQDLYWLMNLNNIKPSGRFKWYEESQPPQLG